MDATSLRKVSDWIIDGARSAATPSQMMAECSERLVQAGLPLWRVGVFVRTLHPEIIGWSFIWKPGEEVHVGTVDFNFRATPEFTFSPLAVVFRDGVEVRADPRGPDSERFPILVDLRAEGVTDYLALPLMFMDRAVHASSWTTKQPGGFTDKQLDAIRSLMAPLARYTEIVSLRRTATMLLDTYVGNSAGERILGGQIRRGHTETMQAAIWLSDLRYRVVGPAAGRDGGRHSQLLLRLSGVRDQRSWRRRAEIHGRWPSRGVSDFRAGEGYAGGLCARFGGRATNPRQRRCAAISDWGYVRALPLRSRVAHGKALVRQYRRRQPTRFHLHRPCRQSRRAAGKNCGWPEPRGSVVGGLRPPVRAQLG
jgi:hypothetical protein